jgi:hypothetical protein
VWRLDGRAVSKCRPGVTEQPLRSIGSSPFAWSYQLLDPSNSVSFALTLETPAPLFTAVRRIRAAAQWKNSRVTAGKIECADVRRAERLGARLGRVGLTHQPAAQGGHPKAIA